MPPSLWLTAMRTQSPMTCVGPPVVPGACTDNTGWKLAATHALESWSAITTTAARPPNSAHRGRAAGSSQVRDDVWDTADMLGDAPLSAAAPHRLARSRNAAARSSPRRRRAPRRPRSPRAVARPGASPRPAPRRRSRPGAARGHARPPRRPSRSTARSRSSSASSACLRRSWIARVSSRASPSARSSGVSVVSMTTTTPSSCATAVPGRGVARISTSLGVSVTPPSVTLPSAWISTSLARAAAMICGTCAPYLRPITGSSGFTRRSTSSDSSPISSIDLTFSSSASRSSSARVSSAVRPSPSVPPGSASHSVASGWRTLMPAWPRSVRPSSTARSSVAMAASSAGSRSAASSASGQRGQVHGLAAVASSTPASRTSTR